MAKGYWIARVDVENQGAYDTYRSLNAIAFAKYGAKFLVRGGEYKLARGEGRKHNVVIEFKDEATARACYASPEYQEAVKHLAQAGHADLVIIGGYDGAQPGVTEATALDKPVLTAIGVISGTSMDGIDVSILASDGLDRVSFGPGASYPYRAETRAALQDVVADAERASAGPLSEIEAAVTADHLAAIERFIADHQIDRATLDLVGLHGQTVYHRPDRRFTRQLIDGPAIAAALGVPTVDRFRYADVAAGGEGAPFAPLYHRALAHGLAQPAMVLNLGGVGNVTYIDGDMVIAFDTGPASAVLDDFMQRRRGLPYDADGALAGSGRVHDDLVAAFMDNPWFDRPAPKSLDRNDFHRRAQIVEPLSDADGAATLSAFTVESIVAALRHVPHAPRRWIVGGGGRLNRHFMLRLAQRLGVPVEPVEAVGWDGDALEAQTFAYLAIRSVKGLALSEPGTTGVPRPLTGGRLNRSA